MILSSVSRFNKREITQNNFFLFLLLTINLQPAYLWSFDSDTVTNSWLLHENLFVQKNKICLRTAKRSFSIRAIICMFTKIFLNKFKNLYFTHPVCMCTVFKPKSYWMKKPNSENKQTSKTNMNLEHLVTRRHLWNRQKHRIWFKYIDIAVTNHQSSFFTLVWMRLF